MVHKMRLVDFAFKAIKNKEKDIELRLNDFDEASIMNNFYSKEEQDKYGALGIEIKLID